MGLTLNHFLVLGAVLFCIGLYGALAKRNAVAAAVALAMIIAIYRKRSTVDVGEIDVMKW